MKVDIILINDLKKGALVNLDMICDRKKIKAPTGFILSGGERKFIVLKNRREILIAIGPAIHRDYYYHKDILVATKKHFPNVEISGGGRVTFSLENVEWSAKFSGDSADFGNFNPIILDGSMRTMISKSLKMRVLFEWIG